MTADSSATNDGRGARAIRPLTDFLHTEAGAGVLLVAAAVAAMVWANSPWADSYVELWNTETVLRIGERALHLTLGDWINDGAMTVFFFVVGLEIKRELTQGELRDPRQAALPVVAAMGGMLVPALVFAALNAGTSGARGWGIPMATDIALVAGVVALLGKRVPSWLKLFLLALAIADDIGAIIVIAVFYSDGVSPTWLLVAVGAVVAARLLRSHVDYIGVYLVLGVICWLALHEAHIHPTLAGVAFGLLTPVTPRRSTGLVDVDQLARDAGSDVSVADAAAVARQAQNSVSVVEWLEFKLHPWSAFVVVPLFALANAGVHLPAAEFDDALSSRVTWGVILGLVVGKTVGIAGATGLAVAFKVGRLPNDVSTRLVIGAAALGGIGFTVSLFMTDLAFGEGRHATDARLGVLLGSLLAALVGCVICLSGRKPTQLTHLFVYGTLRPGDVRWPILQPFVLDEGVDDTVPGDVYDTGVGYPAAVFGGEQAIRGRTYTLDPNKLEVALDALDTEESSVAGGYTRVRVTTANGHEAWAYAYGDGLTLTPIESNDWLTR